MYLFRQFPVTQQVTAPVQQPCAFDVVSIALQVDQTVIRPIEEYLLPPFFRIEHFFRPDIQQRPQFLFHLRRLRRLVQTAVALKHVEQRIHGTLCHDAVFRKLFIGLRIPEPVVGLAVAFCIPAVHLYDLKQLPCGLQRLGISGQPIVSGERINGKRLVIGVLGGVQRLSVICHRPEHTACLAVHAVAHQKAVRMICRMAQFRVVEQHGSL